MNNVLEWVKSNLLIVILCVVMIAAIFVLPMMAGGMNEKVKAELDANVRKHSELTNLGRATHTVSFPDVSLDFKGPVNPPTIEALEKVVTAVKVDADAVVSRAELHNRKNRNVLQPDLFPKADPGSMIVLPERFHIRLMDAYGMLLTDGRAVIAGMPASSDKMFEDLQRADKTFRETKLNVAADATLSDEDMQKLQEHLTEYRVSMYRDDARNFKVYTRVENLNPPRFNNANPPSMLEMFNRQWRYWITEDVMMALRGVNEDAESVLDAPIKIILAVAPHTPVQVVETSGGGGMAGMAGRANAPAALIETPGGAIQPDHSASFITGRKSNSLYDVCDVTVVLIMETARIPEVVNAISKYNFMTVTDLVLSAADPYDYITEGFIFGNEPITRLDLQIETVWLRSWTTPLMPDETKQALNIPIVNPNAGPNAPVG